MPRKKPSNDDTSIADVISTTDDPVDTDSLPLTDSQPPPEPKQSISMDAVLQLYSEHAAQPSARNRKNSFLPFLARSLVNYRLNRRDVYQAILGRLPEPNACRAPYANHQEMAKHIIECFACDEFRSTFIEAAARQFPLSPRGFFLHIPKTAGTTVRERFKLRADTVVWDASYENILHRVAVDPLKLLAVRRQPDVAMTVITGHYRLHDLLRRNAIRSFDRAFTAIRDPIAMLVSCLNYIQTHLYNDPTDYASRRWAEALNITLPLDTRTTNYSLVERLLFSDLFREEYSNLIAVYLGGPNPTLSSILDNLTVANMDVVHVGGLEPYLLDEWHLPPGEGLYNVSLKFIESEFDLSRRARLYLREVLCPFDLVVYDYFWRIAQKTGKSVIKPDALYL